MENQEMHDQARFSRSRAICGSIFGIIVSFSAIPASAKQMSVGKASFEAEAPWSCSLEGSEIVCLKDDTKEPDHPPKRDQLIVVTARTRGADDGVQQFLDHLKKPRSYTGPDSISYTAKIKYVKKTKIAGTTWADSEQFQSEVPGYVTRYFASVIGKTSVIATFSAKKDIYDDFNKEIPKIVATIKVKP
jgi:hypothetical protein